MRVAAIYEAERASVSTILRGILTAVEQGLADEGMPLTPEQAAFLARASS